MIKEYNLDLHHQTESPSLGMTLFLKVAVMTILNHNSTDILLAFIQ